MTCRKFYVYPLVLCLVTIVASPGLLAAADLQALVHAIEGRLAKFGQGTIHYKYYKFTCSADVFRKIKDSFNQKSSGSAIRTRNDRLRALVYGPTIDRVIAYRGTMYYEAQGKQWRLVKKIIEGYGHNIEKLEKLAAKLRKRAPGEKVNVMLPADEDVSCNGKTLLRLENNKTLIESGMDLGLNYPTIRSLDISLAPWHVTMESRPLANQTITVKAQGGVWSISYSDRLRGGRVSDEVSEFDAAKGFAPIGIYGTDNKRTTSETLFHCHRASGNKYIVDSVLTCHYPAAKQAKLSGEIYLIDSWSNKVEKRDLKVKLPKKYILMDERSGEASPTLRIVDNK